MRRGSAGLALAWLVASLSSCVGSTGGDVFPFQAYAAGPPDAVEGQPYVFQSGLGYEVTLTRARVHVGAMYVNRSVPNSVSSDTSCTLPGIYLAEVTTGREVDVLSPRLQPFPESGVATADRGRTGEVWLTGGDVNLESDPTVVLDVRGTAERDGQALPFEGRLTIGTNRVVAPSDPAQPGAKPLCKQRIVSPIALDLTPTEGGHLVLRVDPRGLFANVEFSALPASAETPSDFRFSDDGSDAPSRNLYSGLRANTGTYTLTWEESEP